MEGPDVNMQSIERDQEVRMEQEKLQQLCLYQLILGYRLREAEAKGDKNKCEWKWSRVYDLTYAGTQSTRVATADKAARKLLENEGLTNKYLTKLNQ